MTAYEMLKAAMLTGNAKKVHVTIRELTARGERGQTIVAQLTVLDREFQEAGNEAADDLCKDVLDCFYGYAKPDLRSLLRDEDG